MTFIHGYLLAGLVLVGVPVLLHLIMRQKPKQLAFPAFRFLRQKARINQRKIRLQHWLLLALRMLLIAALCFALARPRLAASRVPFGGEQAVAAVLVFDTSASMEYTVDRTRLDEAKRRAGEILDDLAPNSLIAVFDTGDEAGGDEPESEWLGGSQLRSRIDSLHIRPANAPVNRQIERAYRLLEKVGEGSEAPPRFLFVFSDRTRASWDQAAAKKLKRAEGVNTVYVDVGVDNPKDLAITNVEVEPPVVAPGGKVTIKATVRATGADHENELSCQLDPEPEAERQPDRQAVTLPRGQGRIYPFERDAPAKPDGVKEMAFHVVVKLGTTDALPSNNVRHATFLVRDKRKVLAIVNEKAAEAKVLRAALDATGTFQCDVKTVAEAAALDAKELQAYPVVWLFEVPRPTEGLWGDLAAFVKRGGGLAVVPAGNEQVEALDDFNREGVAANVLPAKLVQLVKVPADERGVPWAGFSGQHPLTKPFNDWSRTTSANFNDPNTQPLANGYWVVNPVEKEGGVIASYDDQTKRPALVERHVGAGTVVLFTTPLSALRDRAMDKAGLRPWHNYWFEDSNFFALELADLTCRYLGGDSTTLDLNYQCGHPVTVPMPPAPFAPPFTLQGPDVTPAESNIPAPDNSPTLAITQALGPGNFTVVDAKGKPFAGFSLNVRAEESDLERVPVEDIEAALGEGVVLAPERKLNVGDVLQSRWAPPVELLPYFMMFLFLVLTVESLLANFFYRRQPPSPAEPQPQPQGVAP
jgi:hypothetical protein